MNSNGRAIRLQGDQSPAPRHTIRVGEPELLTALKQAVPQLLAGGCRIPMPALGHEFVGPTVDGSLDVMGNYTIAVRFVAVPHEQPDYEMVPRGDGLEVQLGR